MANNHINYIEFKSKDLAKTKQFYNNCFGWTFTDYGESYVAFSDAGMEGGFEIYDGEIKQGVLVVLFHDQLEVIMKTIVKYGGVITVDIFSFPGGRRFHFKDPSGNELAVWCDK